MDLRPTKRNEDAVVGRRKRLPHVGWLWGRRFRLPTGVFNGVGGLRFVNCVKNVKLLRPIPCEACLFIYRRTFENLVH
jgi:hypothetical protein